MSFLRGKRRRQQDAEQPQVDGPSDALAEALRQWGGRCVPIGELDPVAWQMLFEAWARHIVLGTEPPQADELPEELATEADPSRPREWARLIVMLRESRDRETSEVTRGLADLREALRVFIESFHRACLDGEEDEAGLASELDRLRTAADEPDTDKLREEVRACVGRLEEASAERREREKKRLLALSDRVDKVSNELAAAREQMSTDALTGVYNRAGFDEQMSLIVKLGSIAPPSAFLFMIDVDHFKWVNDRYGHQAGDAVLAEVARRLTNTFRRKADFLARFGGDEFAAVVLDANPQAARAIGDRMLFAARDAAIRHDGEEIRVGISIGAAPQRAGEEASAWIERADRALYRAKEKGRDCLVVVT